MVEDGRELKHPVSENNGPPDIVSDCSSTVPVIECDGHCPGSSIEINR